MSLHRTSPASVITERPAFPLLMVMATFIDGSIHAPRPHCTLFQTGLHQAQLLLETPTSAGCRITQVEQNEQRMRVLCFRNSNAFTLAELIVIVAILAALTAMV